MAHPQRLEDIVSDDESPNIPPVADDVPPEAHADAIVFQQVPNGNTLEALLAVSVAEQARIWILLKTISKKNLKTALTRIAKGEESTDVIKEKLITKQREEK